MVGGPQWEMALCWVTGVSGTGKSTIVRELRRFGEIAWDGDDLSFWRDRDTGDAVATPDVRPDGWVARHAWVIDPARVRECRAAAEGRVGYLAGGAENEADVWDLFDVVVHLVTDDDTIRRRLADRTENDFGKTGEELAVIMGWNAVLEQRYRDRGAIVLDAGRPLPVVVEDVRAAGAG